MINARQFRRLMAASDSGLDSFDRISRILSDDDAAGGAEMSWPIVMELFPEDVTGHGMSRSDG
jgi:hypothetical protein